MQVPEAAARNAMSQSFFGLRARSRDVESFKTYTRGGSNRGHIPACSDERAVLT